MAKEIAENDYCGHRAFLKLRKVEFKALNLPDAPTLFKSGEVICKQGTPGAKMYFIEEGTVRCYRENKQGKQISVRNLTAGGFFGEIALLTGEPRSLHVKAKSDVLLWELDSKKFDTLLEVSPAIARAIMVEMARHLESSAALIGDVQEQLKRDRTLPERITESFVGQMGTLWFTMLNLIGIAVWILYNRLAQNPPDSREFSGLGLVATCEALIVAVLVLTKQNRDTKDNIIFNENVMLKIEKIEEKLLVEDTLIEAEQKQIRDNLPRK